MTAAAEAWVDGRLASSPLRLTADEREKVVETAAGLLPFIETWSHQLRGSTILPFPVTGRLRQPDTRSAPSKRFVAAPRDDGSDPYRTMTSAVVDDRADGVTFTVKANIDVAGVATSCGASPENPVLTPEPVEQSAPVVDRLIERGGRLVGIANLGELALDATSDNPWHGRVENPAAPGCSAGGSSGGSAAGLAAGIARLSLGSDSGGSVRIPAALCGVFGYRPTPGRIPLAGLRGPAWSVDSIGLMADSMAILRWGAEASGAIRVAETPKRPRVGVLLDNELGPTQHSVEDRYRRCLEKISSSVDVEPVDLSSLVAAPAITAVIAYAEAAAQLAHAVHQRPTSFGRPARQLVQMGSLISADEYLLAQRMRSALWQHWLAATSELDCVITPTVPMLPFRHGTVAEIPGDESALAIFAIIRFTALANTLALPAVAIPAGLAEGMPVGLQLIGPHDSDDQLLALADQISELIIEH
jgi:Asp-tRNA(Asn)/Glu-tRNA(Gln) amidotransferase A subunit family amidase